MASNNPIIRVILSAVDEVTGVAEKASGGLNKFRDTASSVAKALGAIFVTGAFAEFFREAIAESAKAEEGLIRLRTVVRNSGADFGEMSPEIENVVGQLARLTKFTDDDLRAALTTMVGVTGNTAGSLKHLGDVADLATFKHIGLEDAALAYGKAMNGNVTAFNKLGIAGESSNAVLDNARAKFGGLAQQEGASLLGTLVRIGNQWGEVKEATGNAITGNEGARESASRLVDMLASLAQWVEANEEPISRLADFVLAFGTQAIVAGGALWDSLRPALGIIVGPLKLALSAVQTLGYGFGLLAQTVKYTAGDILVALGTLIGRGANLLKAFGITVGYETAISLREAGTRMQDEAAFGVDRVRRVFIDGMDVLWKDQEAGHKRRESGAKDHEGSILGIAQNGNQKLLDAQEKAAAKAKAATEKHNREMIKQLEDVGKQLATERAKQGDEAAAAAAMLAQQLKVNLGEASAEALVLTNDAMGRLLETLRGRIPAEQWHALNAELTRHKQNLGDLLPPASALAESAKDAAAANKEMGEETAKAGGALDKAVRSGADLARAFVDAASATGIIDDKMANVLNSAISLASSLPKAFSGDPAAIAQAVTSLANIIVGVGSSETEKRRAAAATANTAAIDRLTREVGNLNLRESGKTFAGVQSAVDASIQARADARASGKGPGAADEAAKAAFVKSLKSQGIGLEEARALFKELFGRDMSMANAGTFFQDIQAFSEGLANTEFGQFGADFEGQLDAITKGFDILGTTDDDEKLKEFQQLAGRFSPALKDALAGDLATQEGRAKATANLQALFQKLKSGGLKPEDIGVSGSQFLAMIQTLLPLLSGADGTLGNGSAVTPPTTSSAGVESMPPVSATVVANSMVGGPAYSPSLPTPSLPNAFAPMSLGSSTSITNHVGDMIFNFPEVTDAQAAADAVAERVASILGATYTRQRTALGLAT